MKDKKKLPFYTEGCYAFGIVFLAFGCALMERANFGLSMVVAPAYLVYLKLSEYLSFITFGMTEYIFQAFLLVLMIIAVRRFKISYLFSFITAVLYGYTLNAAMFLVSLIGFDSVAARVVFFVLGAILCSAGVAFVLHTYIPGEVYELIVKEIPSRFGLNITKFKTVYDCVSLAVGVLMSFCFFGFGHFEGVKLGTLICALTNGFLIGFFSQAMEKCFEFKDALPIRKYFETTCENRKDH